MPLRQVASERMFSMFNSNSNGLDERPSLNPFRRREPREIDPNEKKVMEEPGIRNYFKLFGRSFSNIVSINLVMMLGCLPLFFALIVMAGYFSHTSSAPLYTVFAPLYGAFTQSPNAYSAAILAEFSIQSSVTILSTVDYVLLGISALTVFTFGPVMVGSTYLMRNIVRQEHVFIFHDFMYAIKRNLKQAVLFGIADIAIILVLIYDIVLYNLNFSQSMLNAVMFFAMICIAVLYFFMRMYIYPMMLTFDLSVRKLLKNALFFSVLGIKRNICALLGTLAVVVATALLMTLVLPIGIIIPFVFLFSFLVYTATYCAYPVIDRYMIAPYYKKDGTPREDEAEEGTSEE